jgi:class 3 adenylate cyclase
MDYFSHLFDYLSSTKSIVDHLTMSIEEFVAKELDMFQGKMKIPLSIFITLTVFIPVVIYITLHTTTSMMKYSEIYNERVVNFQREKKKTEQLLTALLPRSIIHQLKKGETPIPQTFSSVSILMCDICSFTQIASESTAHQIVELLNDLYNQFDDCIDNYDVYTVETVGDAYLIAAGMPEQNECHAPEICSMALELMSKVVPFEVKHKPGYRIKVRIGIDSGTASAGVIGDKIPHYSVFGETVEMASFMESTSDPMKIQVSKTIIICTQYVSLVPNSK